MQFPTTPARCAQREQEHRQRPLTARRRVPAARRAGSGRISAPRARARQARTGRAWSLRGDQRENMHARGARLTRCCTRRRGGRSWAHPPLLPTRSRLARREISGGQRQQRLAAQRRPQRLPVVPRVFDGPKNMLCSWPLPHAITRSPRRASEHAKASARPRSITRQKVSPTPPRRRQPWAIPSRMPTSDSVRGSSAVSTDTSPARADLGHHTALRDRAGRRCRRPRSRGGPRGSSRGPLRVCCSALGEREVDDRWSCLVDAPMRPDQRHGAQARDGGPQPGGVVAEERAAGRHCRQQVDTLNGPKQPRVDRLAGFARPDVQRVASARTR